MFHLLKLKPCIIIISLGLWVCHGGMTQENRSPINSGLFTSKRQAMKKIVAAFKNISESQLIKLVTALGILLTARVIYIQHGWINADSVLYFEMARLFSIGEWKQGMALYNWPLYSALIAFVHKITGIGIQHSAQILDVIFFALTTFSFASLIRLAGGNKTTIACGALLLFSSLYIVGDALPMLLRDHGFWAFLLTSLIFFIRFYRSGKLSDAMLWQLCAIVAVLFRIEAITFLLLLPLIFFTNAAIIMHERIRQSVQTSLITISMAVLLVAALLLIPSVHLSDFGRIQEVVTLFGHGYLQLTQNLAGRAQFMSEQVLGGYLEGYGLFGVIVTFIGIILVKSASTAGWITLGLLAVTYKTKDAKPATDAQKVFYWVSALALLNMGMIILNTFILSSRYVIALGFMLLLLASFSLASLFKSWHGKTKASRIKKWMVVVVVVLLSLCLIKNVWPKRDNYNYEQDAVAFVKQYQSQNDTVFYVSQKARYYGGAPYLSRGYDFWNFTSQTIKDGSIQQYDYLVINMDNGYPEREKELTKALKNHQLIKEFMGFKSRKKIMIFAKKN